MAFDWTPTSSLKSLLQFASSCLGAQLQAFGMFFRPHRLVNLVDSSVGQGDA
jgi:hypothetical protein